MAKERPTDKEVMEAAKKGIIIDQYDGNPPYDLDDQEDESDEESSG